MKTKLNLSAMFLSALLMALPDRANAQFLFTTNKGSITITGYTGSSGVVVIPGMTNGLPVTRIGSSAFAGITNLTSVTIPNTVTNLGLWAFDYCEFLTGIYFQGNVPSLGGFGSEDVWGEDPMVTVYCLPGTSGWGSYLNGRPVVMLNPPIPAGSLQVTLTPAAAITNGMQWQVDGGLAQFSGAIVLGLSVGNHTVSFSPLNGWAMPANQTVAVSVNSITVVSGNYWQLIYRTNVGAISITGYKSPAPGGAIALPGTINGLPVTRIGSQAFEFCASLAGVTIPNSVTNIGNEAFADCSRLAMITMNPPNLFYSSMNGVLFNKDQTTLIQYPAGLGGSYAIPQSVTNIGACAFLSCTGLTCVMFPDSVTIIGGVAFLGCISLTNLAIGANVTIIGGQAFQACLGLTSVVIPNSVTYIEEQAFCYCTNLANVTIGTNVIDIWNDAFLDCYGLTGVYFQGNAPLPPGDLFNGDDLATVYYLPWTTGWGTPGTLFGGCPTALWLPRAQTSTACFGAGTQQFGFNITWANDQVVVVEACTDLANPAWIPVGTNTLTGGSSYFNDPDWTNYPGRFYRLRWP